MGSVVVALARFLAAVVAVLQAQKSQCYRLAVGVAVAVGIAFNIYLSEMELNIARASVSSMFIIRMRFNCGYCNIFSSRIDPFITFCFPANRCKNITTCCSESWVPGGSADMSPVPKVAVLFVRVVDISLGSDLGC